MDHSAVLRPDSVMVYVGVVGYDSLTVTNVGFTCPVGGPVGHHYSQCPGSVPVMVNSDEGKDGHSSQSNETR